MPREPNGMHRSCSLRCRAFLIAVTRRWKSNGRPAVCYSDASRILNYLRAADAEGTAWSPPVALNFGGANALACSLAVVDGKPAIACHAPGSLDLHYVEAKDHEGTSAAKWNAP